MTSIHSQIVAKNKAMNQEVYGLLRLRAQPMPPAFNGMFSKFSMSTYCIIEELIERDPDLPQITSSKVGEITSDQILALYHVTVWSLAALFVHSSKYDKNTLKEVCSLFTGALNEESAFTKVIDSVFDVGGTEFLGLCLHREYYRILRLPSKDDPGFIPLTVLLASALQAMHDSVDE